MPNDENVEVYNLFQELIEIANRNIYNNQIETGLNLIVKIIEFYEDAKHLLDASNIDQVDSVFNSIVNASENKDYILVADLLEYELKGLLVALIKE